MAMTLYTETVSILSTQTEYDLDVPWIVPNRTSCSIDNARGNEVNNLYPSLKPDFKWAYGSDFLFAISHGTGTGGVDQVFLTELDAERFAGLTLTLSYYAFSEDPYV